MQLPVAGVVPVLETPFHDDGEVDRDGFARMVRAVVGAGVAGVMFPGFASEFASLTDEERDDLTVMLLELTAHVPGLTRVISIPDHATVVAVRRGRRAIELGADAVNILPPYRLATGRNAVRSHIVAIARAVAPHPVVLQYAPLLTGTALDAESIAAMAAEVTNLVEVKVESTPPGALIAELRAQTPSIPSAVGNAGVHLIDALRRGAAGVQPGCSFPEIYLRIWELWHAGDEGAATALHGRLLPYISYWMQSIDLVIAAEKHISMRRGWFASDHCRAPARGLDEEERRMVDRFLAEFADLLGTSPLRE